MSKNEMLEMLDFYGNFMFYGCYIYAHAILIDTSNCIIDGEVGFCVLYNPNKELVMLFSEKGAEKELIEINDDEKAELLEKMKKAYAKKHKRELVYVWHEFTKVHKKMYA